MRDMGINKITLTRDEEVQAAAAAFICEFRGEVNFYFHDQAMRGNIHDSIKRTAEAFGAEIAAARFFGIADFKIELDKFKIRADIGNRIEIKHTRWLDGHLILNPRDRADDLAVLVVGESPTYYVKGWIPIKAAKTSRFKHDKTESWWVSQHNLNSMENLKESNYGQIEI
jgi:hypothetical protein